MDKNVNPFTLLKFIKSPVFTGFFLLLHFIRARRKYEKSTKKKSSNESII